MKKKAKEFLIGFLLLFFSLFFPGLLWADITLEEFNTQMGRDPDAPAPTITAFIRGDVNGDGLVNAADVQVLSNYLNGNHALLSSYDIGDVDGSGTIDQADKNYLLNYLAGTGPAPALPFPTPAVFHPYLCTTSPCLAILNNRVIKFVVNYLTPSSTGCAQWSAIAVDPANNIELARYELEAIYGDAATECTFNIKYSKPEDPIKNKAAISETNSTISGQTFYHDEGGQQVRDEIDVNTAITILADLVNVDTGSIQGIDSSKQNGSVYKPADSQQNSPPPAGQPGGGNQDFPRCPNGCSGPVNIPFDLFKKSPCAEGCCDIHDLCYTLGGDRQKKNKCDASLGSCLSRCTPGWQKIVDHLIPPFITPEIAQWFRETFADSAFRWTNEPFSCFYYFDASRTQSICRDEPFQKLSQPLSCMDADSGASHCIIRHDPLTSPAQDEWEPCVQREYIDWPAGPWPASTLKSSTSQTSTVSSSGIMSPNFVGGQCPAIAHCGDGNIDPGEECDGDNLQGKTCATLGLGVPLAPGATLKCTPDCKFDRRGCTCGNGQLDAQWGEDCEGSNHGGKTCQSLGYQTGEVACANNCRFDVSTCSPLKVISGSPTGILSFGTTDVPLTVTTNRAATCRYGTDPQMPFNNMIPFTTTGGTRHAKTVNPVYGTNDIYVLCIDSAGNMNTTPYHLSYFQPLFWWVQPYIGELISSSTVTFSWDPGLWQLFNFKMKTADGTVMFESGPQTSNEVTVNNIPLHGQSIRVEIQASMSLTPQSSDWFSQEFIYSTIIYMPPPTISLTAPSSIVLGQPATVSWTVANATSCQGTGNWDMKPPPGWNNPSIPTGSMTVSVDQDLTLTMTCSGPGGSTSKSATIILTYPPKPTVSLTASPLTVSAGQSTTLTWSSSNATSCYGYANQGPQGNNWVGQHPASGSMTVGPLSSFTTFTFSLTCNGIAESASASVTVKLLPDTTPPDITNVGPTTVTFPAPVVLNLKTNENATCKYFMQSSPPGGPYTPRPFTDASRITFQSDGTPTMNHQQYVGTFAPGNYYAFVECQDPTGNIAPLPSSGYDAIVSFFVQTSALSAPNAPLNVTATAIDATHIKLNWTAPGSGSLLYNIYRRQWTGGVWTSPTQIYGVANATTWTNGIGTAPVQPGMKYEFYLTAQKIGPSGLSIPSPASARATVTTP